MSDVAVMTSEMRVLLAGPVADDVARAAAGNARGRKGIAALVRALRAIGEADVADGLEPLVAAERRRRTVYDIGAWLAVQYDAGRIGEGEAWAAQDIRRALALVGCSGSLVTAVDPSRVIVDGGAVDAPTAPRGGRAIDVCVQRYDRWRREVCERADLKRRVLRGRKASMSFVEVVKAVLCDGVAPRTLETRLGVKHDRCVTLVLGELRAYAKLRVFD